MNTNKVHKESLNKALEDGFVIAQIVVEQGKKGLIFRVALVKIEHGVHYSAQVIFIEENSIKTVFNLMDFIRAKGVLV